MPPFECPTETPNVKPPTIPRGVAGGEYCPVRLGKNVRDWDSRGFPADKAPLSRLGSTPDPAYGKDSARGVFTGYM